MPGAPGYDPTRLASVLTTRGLFDQEPRDPKWAPLVEQNLKSYVDAHVASVLPSIRNVAVVCKTTACKVTWEGGDDAPGQMGFLLTMLLRGSRAQGSSSAKEWTAIYAGGAFSDVPQGDADALFRKLSADRVKRIANAQKVMRLTGRNPYGNFDISKLQEE